MQKEPRIEEIVFALLGTRQTLEEVLTPDELENSNLLKAIDEKVAQCGTCNWWDERNNLHDGECDECCLEGEMRADDEDS